MSVASAMALKAEWEKFFCKFGEAIKRKRSQTAIISIHGAQEGLTGHTTKQFQKETEFWQIKLGGVFPEEFKTIVL